jgi:hypothetical protein
VAAAISGVGCAFVLVGQANVAVRAVPPSQTGVSSGVNTNIRLIGGAIGAAVMAAVLTSASAGR